MTGWSENYGLLKFASRGKIWLLSNHVRLHFVDDAVDIVRTVALFLFAICHPRPLLVITREIYMIFLEEKGLIDHLLSLELS